MATADKSPKRQKTLSVDLGSKLLAEVEQLRRMIQDSCGGEVTISRGDVVRLALRRLFMSWLCHLIEQGHDVEDARASYQETWQTIQKDGTSPEWLVPAYLLPEQPKPAPKKKGRKA